MDPLSESLTAPGRERVKGQSRLGPGRRLLGDSVGVGI